MRNIFMRIQMLHILEQQTAVIQQLTSQQE